MKITGRLSTNVEDRRGLDTGPGFSKSDNPFGDATFNRPGPVGPSASRKVLPYTDPEAEYKRRPKTNAEAKQDKSKSVQVPLPQPRPKNPFVR